MRFHAREVSAAVSGDYECINGVRSCNHANASLHYWGEALPV